MLGDLHIKITLKILVWILAQRIIRLRAALPVTEVGIQGRGEGYSHTAMT